MSKKKVLVLIAEGSEEMEVVIFADLLRRAAIDVDILSIYENNIVNCSRNVKILADKNINDNINYDEYDLIYIPGGNIGVQNLINSPFVKEIINKFNEKNKLIVSICAGPLVLKNAINLDSKKVTCYPTLRDNFINYVDELVVEDGNIITSQGPATTFILALKVIQKLRNQDISNTIYNATLLYKIINNQNFF